MFIKIKVVVGSSTSISLIEIATILQCTNVHLVREAQIKSGKDANVNERDRR
jgi:hypothetical protein